VERRAVQPAQGRDRLRHHADDGRGEGWRGARHRADGRVERHHRAQARRGRSATTAGVITSCRDDVGPRRGGRRRRARGAQSPVRPPWRHASARSRHTRAMRRRCGRRSAVSAA
jgi:hypothetical protein